MVWEYVWEDPFADYLNSFDPLIGDRRTGVTFRETIRGIVGSGSTLAARIAAASPIFAAIKEAPQRILRMVTGESTKRSEIDDEHLTEKLRARGVAHLSGADTDEVWLIGDLSELRKPQARAMPYLMKVRALDGRLVPGYRTAGVLGVTPQRRGVLYQRLFSSEAPGFISEPNEIQTMIETASRAVAGRFPSRIWSLDRGFDDVAVWRTLGELGDHGVIRVKHRDRRIEYADRDGVWHSGKVEDAVAKLRPMATCQTEMVVRLNGQPKAKRQELTAEIRMTPVRLTYDPQVRRPENETETPARRTRTPKRLVTRSFWLVEVRLLNTTIEPLLLMTDLPVEDAESAVKVFRIYRQRWSVEDAFGFTKECLGWEEVQVLDFEGIRTLVAMAWVAAGFLYELGVTFEWEEVQLLAKLGGYRPHKGREPGRKVLTWGLRRLIEMRVTQALLERYEAEHGTLPPRILALLGRTPCGEL